MRLPPPLRRIAAIAVPALFVTSCVASSPAAMTLAQDRPSGPPLLSDILGINRQCTIIADYIREVAPIALQIQSSDSRTLILTPLNTAITSLERKPWLGADNKHEAPEFDALKKEERAARNIERFAKAHIIPFKQGNPLEKQELQNLLGHAVFIEKRETSKYVQPGDLRVVDEKDAENGIIFVVAGVMDPLRSMDAASTDHHADL